MTNFKINFLADSPILLISSLFLVKYFIFSLNDLTSLSTKKPFIPFEIISSQPPTLLDITGFPLAKASNTLSEKPLMKKHKCKYQYYDKIYTYCCKKYN